MQGEVTELLVRWRSGDADILERLMPLLYRELRKLAASHLRRSPGYQTLQPTALIHEAWIRLADQTSVNAEDRVHFFGICSRLMRLILIDHIRAKKTQKRGGEVDRVELDEATAGTTEAGQDVETLHLALEALEKLDARKAKIVEMRFFGGLTAEEIAVHLGIGTATVTREMRSAQAWLAREMGGV